MSEFCFDCKYSSVVNSMQCCAWKSGLASAYRKCEKYERSWQKTISPYLFLAMILVLPIRLIVLAIWGI